MAEASRRRPRRVHPLLVRAALDRARPLPPGGARVLRLVPRRAATSPRQAADSAPRCPKCRSAFLTIEPAFVHCHYCGAMTRRPAGSLDAQMDYELHSGLLIAV